jgi:hypothetical protein
VSEIISIIVKCINDKGSNISLRDKDQIYLSSSMDNHQGKLTSNLKIAIVFERGPTYDSGNGGRLMD